MTAKNSLPVFHFWLIINGVLISGLNLIFCDGYGTCAQPVMGPVNATANVKLDAGVKWTITMFQDLFREKCCFRYEFML